MRQPLHTNLFQRTWFFIILQKMGRSLCAIALSIALFTSVHGVFEQESALAHLKTGCRKGFHPNTLVTTARGLKKIKDIAVHDLVTSFNAQGDLEQKQVKRRFKNRVPYYIRLQLADGTILQAAPDQQFFSPTRRQWIDAEKIAPTTALAKNKHEFIDVCAIEKIDNPLVFYDISVEGNENFCVAKSKINAHNMAPYMEMCTNLFPAAAGGGGLLATIVGASQPIVVAGVAAGIIAKIAFDNSKQNTTPQDHPEENVAKPPSLGFGTFIQQVQGGPVFLYPNHTMQEYTSHVERLTGIPQQDYHQNTSTHQAPCHEHKASFRENFIGALGALAKEVRRRDDERDKIRFERHIQQHASHSMGDNVTMKPGTFVGLQDPASGKKMLAKVVGIDSRGFPVIGPLDRDISTDVIPVDNKKIIGGQIEFCNEAGIEEPRVIGVYKGTKKPGFFKIAAVFSGEESAEIMAQKKALELPATPPLDPSSIESQSFSHDTSSSNLVSKITTDVFDHMAKRDQRIGNSRSSKVIQQDDHLDQTDASSSDFVSPSNHVSETAPNISEGVIEGTQKTENSQSSGTIKTDDCLEQTHEFSSSAYASQSPEYITPGMVQKVGEVGIFATSALVVENTIPNAPYMVKDFAARACSEAGKYYLNPKIKAISPKVAKHGNWVLNTAILKAKYAWQLTSRGTGVAYKGLSHGTKALYHGAQYGANFAYQNAAQGATFIGQNALPIGLAVGGTYITYRIVKKIVQESIKASNETPPNIVRLTNNYYLQHLIRLQQQQEVYIAAKTENRAIGENIIAEATEFREKQSLVHLKDHKSTKKELARKLALKHAVARVSHPKGPDDDEDKERYKRPDVRYTPEEIRKIAQKKGWEEIKNHDVNTHGQKLWHCPKDNRYYSYDNTGHGGGMWKEFMKDGKSFKRFATLNAELIKIRD